MNTPKEIINLILGGYESGILAIMHNHSIDIKELSKEFLNVLRSDFVYGNCRGEKYREYFDKIKSVYEYIETKLTTLIIYYLKEQGIIFNKLWVETDRILIEFNLGTYSLMYDNTWYFCNSECNHSIKTQNELEFDLKNMPKIIKWLSSDGIQQMIDSFPYFFQEIVLFKILSKFSSVRVNYYDTLGNEKVAYLSKNHTLNLLKFNTIYSPYETKKHIKKYRIYDVDLINKTIAFSKIHNDTILEKQTMEINKFKIAHLGHFGGFEIDPEFYEILD